MLLGANGALLAQSDPPKSKIELLGAKDLKYDERLGIPAQRLIGDVSFRHQGALMYCDSAYLYKEQNSLDAFGNVHINQGDTILLYSDKLMYNGNTRLAKVRNNVTLIDKEMTLTTHILDYNRRTDVAVFHDRGKIVSTANDNELISCEGTYEATTEMFYFRDSVVLINPSYIVETDTLNYHNATEVAYFEGPTFIFSDENTIYCENGWYDTQNDISQFNENAFLDNGKQVLRGDSLWYSRLDGLGRAFRNVSVVDTTDHYIITGQKGSYFEESRTSIITEMAELIQYDDRDSLFLHADTLMALDDEILGNQLFAYRNARFFRQDMQGVADSIFFAKSDSIIHLFHSPVLWSDDLQITGDTMEITNTAQGLDKLLVYENSMLIDRVDSTQYNQIKGRRLTGYFRDNELYEVYIEGNGQSLYFAMEERRVPIKDRKKADEESPEDSPEEGEVVEASLEEEEAVQEQISKPVDGGIDAELRDNEDADIEIDADELAVSDSLEADSVLASDFRIVQEVMGVNRALCSNIAIFMEDRRVQRIRFLVKPEGKFIPIDLFDTDDSYLDGFTWQSERRPLNRQDIFRRISQERKVELAKKYGEDEDDILDEREEGDDDQEEEEEEEEDNTDDEEGGGNGEDSLDRID